MNNLKNLTIVFCIILSNVAGFGQFVLDPVPNQNIGTYFLKNLNPPYGANFFYLTGDGMFSSTNNSTRHYPRQMGTTNFLAESYRLDPYTVIPPFRIATGTTHGTNYSPFNLLHTPCYLNGPTDVGTSWLPNQITYNYFIFKAIRPQPDARGNTPCLEFHYNHNMVKPDISNPTEIKIKDQYPNEAQTVSWFKSLGDTPSSMSGYTRKISWDFNAIELADTGLIYIPMQALGPVTSTFKIGTKFCNETQLREKHFKVAATPNDPNSIEAHEECFYTPNNVPANINTLDAHKINYTVRFQNQGTGPATNVQVVINLDNKVDPTTIKLIDSEYPCTFTVTPILNLPSTYRLAIIFNNINLPGIAQRRPTVTYDESESWATFSICTKRFSNLPIVDGCLGTINNDCCFNHQAAIYFDAQPPVYTNTATTCIVCSGTQKRVNASLCSSGLLNRTSNQNIGVNPNPAGDNFTLTLVEPLENAQLQIFDQVGRLVSTKRYNYIDNNTIFDIQQLNVGIYTMNITTINQSIVMRFIKQ